MTLRLLLIFSLVFSSASFGENLLCRKALGLKNRAHRVYRYQRVRARRGWAKFKRERAAMGRKRWIIAPIKDPGRDIHGAIFRSVIDPVLDLPVELYNLLGHRVLKLPPIKHRISNFTSMPFGMLFYTGLIIFLQLNANSASVDAIHQSAEMDRIGSRYVGQWMVNNGWSGTQAIDLLRPFDAALLSGDASVFEPRINDLKKMGIVTNENVHELRQVLITTMDAARTDGFVTDKEFDDFLIPQLENMDWYTELTEQQKVYVQYLKWPRLTYEEKPDTHWMSYMLEPDRREALSDSQNNALSAFDSLAINHGEHIPGVVLVKLIADTISNEHEIEEKLKRAKELGILESLGGIAHRIDIPAFTGELTLHDLSGDVVVDDELDRWELLFSDDRFVDIRERFLAGEITDLAALGELTLSIQALNPIYKVFQSENRVSTAEPDMSLSVENSCQLMHSQDPKIATPLMTQFRDYAQAPKFEGFTEPLMNKFVYAQTRMYYEYVISQGLGEKADIAYEKAETIDTNTHQALENGSLSGFLKSQWGFEGEVSCQ